jgi:hypothetical protein
MSINRFALCALVCLPICAAAQENPVAPYVDPSQLDCPGLKHSFYLQPWRAFLETRPADTLVRGIGINYNAPPECDDLAVRLLAESGFKSFRIEVGWDNVAWDETHLNNEKRLRHLLDLCKRYGVRPNLLLNANHGVPGPTRFFEKRLAEDAPKGSRAVRFTDTQDLVLNHSGINHLTGSAAAEAMIVGIDPETGVCQLSKPLTKDLLHDRPVKMAMLKFQPLFPVGTEQFEQTAAGWLRYARLVTAQAKAAGIEEFDVEIWNELSFGSYFTDARHYYVPAPFPERKNFLLPGGSCWELARRTVDTVKSEHPRARCIWGFSNTTFFHCPVDKLPPGMDGQSYHPYGTGTRTYPKDEDRPTFNRDGFVPTLQTRLPEGWAHLFVKTETLMKLLNPQARLKHPPGVAHFHHYMTEHGVAPPECGVTDPSQCWSLKTKCALRSYCLWINKGIDVLDYFCAFDRHVTGFGLLPPNLMTLPRDAKWDDVATPPMRAIRNLARAFVGATPMPSTRPLHVDVTELGPPQKIFEGDATHPPLWQRQAFAALPFEVNDGKLVIALYAMTYDATKPFPEQQYRLKLSGLGARPAGVTLYDPIRDQRIAVKVRRRAANEIELELPVVDTPRLLTLMH